jgi:hypothetical protein
MANARRTGQSARFLSISLPVALLLAVGTSSESNGQLALVPRHAADSLDPNGFLRDPVWQGVPSPPPDIEALCHFRTGRNGAGDRMLRIGRGQSDQCTSQRDTLSLNQAGDPIGLGVACSSNDEVGLIRGHINWFPITVAGRLYWEGYASGRVEDHDITMLFDGPDGSPLTTGNASPFGTGPDKRLAFEIEYNFYESLGRLPRYARGWWGAFRENLYAKPRDPRMHGLIDGRPAIVTGLFGLDGVHGFQSELHPVYAIAILVDSKSNRGATIQRWAVMIRDRGNEGECATGVMPLYSQVIADSAETSPRQGRNPQMQYTMDLGWLSGATGATIRLDPNVPAYVTERADTAPRAGQGGPSFRVEEGHHVFVDVQFRRPDQTNADLLTFAEFEVAWEAAPDTATLSVFARVPPAAVNEKGQATPLVPVAEEVHLTTDSSTTRPSPATSAPKGWWPWDRLVPETLSVSAQQVAHPFAASRMSTPVTPLVGVRGAIEFCSDDGWAKSGSCWTDWRPGLAVGFHGFMAIAYLPPHSRLLPWSWWFFGTLAELAFESDSPWPIAAVPDRGSVRLGLTLPSTSAITNQAVLRAYPLGTLGLGTSFKQGGARLVLGYGAGAMIGHPSGAQWFLEWQHTKFTGLGGRSTFTFGRLIKPFSSKPK